MSNFYNKFHRCETLLCDIQNCHTANWPIKLLEINMRYNNCRLSPRKECYIYFIIPNVPFLQRISPPWDIAVWHYINITLFTGWHCRLLPRGNIVNRGGAEVDNAFRGVTIYYVTPVKNVIFILLYRMSYFYNRFHRLRRCRVTFKIVIWPIDQSDCWKLTWGIIIKIVTQQIDQSDCWKLTWGIIIYKYCILYKMTW